MLLSEALFGLPYEKQFARGKTIIQMKTLSTQDRVEVLRKVQGLDLYAQTEAMKIPVLARSIMSINGQLLENWNEVRDIKKQFPDMDIVIAKEQALEKMDDGGINIVYQDYLELVDEATKEREKLSKKASVPSKPDQSTNSAEPSEERPQENS